MQSRGEFTVVLAGAADEESTAGVPVSADVVADEFYRLTNSENMLRRKAISLLARRFNMSSRDIYKIVEASKDSVG